VTEGKGDVATMSSVPAVARRNSIVVHAGSPDVGPRLPAERIITRSVSTPTTKGSSRRNRTFPSSSGIHLARLKNR